MERLELMQCLAATGFFLQTLFNIKKEPETILFQDLNFKYETFFTHLVEPVKIPFKNVWLNVIGSFISLGISFIVQKGSGIHTC
jgi:hypothetical protein